MSYLRVVMVDAKKPENLKNILHHIDTDASEIFPEIQQMTAIAMGETTGLTISVYKDEAVAAGAVAQRDAAMDEDGAELEVAFEGPLADYYYNDPIKTATN